MDVRTTVDLPAEDLKRLKIRAAEYRTSVKNLVREAVKQYLATDQEPTEPAWMAGFGAFKDEKDDNARIQAIIDDEFSKIDMETWK